MAKHVHETDERVLSLVQYRTLVRNVMDAGLVIGLVALVIPFGFHDLRGYDVNTYEWLLSGLALLAVLGIVIDMIRRPVWPWPYMLATFTWSASAAYAAMLPDAVVGARIALAALNGGYAIASAGAWRIAAHWKGREL